MWWFKKKKKKIEEEKQTEESKVLETNQVEQEKTEEAEEEKSAKKEKETKTVKTPAKKADKKETESAPKTRKALYRVMYDKEARMWIIKKDGAKRTIASFTTKEDALNRVKELSASKDLNFVVHKKDGRFQKK